MITSSIKGKKKERENEQWSLQEEMQAKKIKKNGKSVMENMNELCINEQ